jgi:putative DNA primase/helicase
MVDERLAFVEKSIRHCLDKGFSYERTQTLIEGWNEDSGGAVNKEKIDHLLRKIYNKEEIGAIPPEEVKKDSGLPEGIRELLRNASLTDAGNADCFRAVWNEISFIEGWGWMSFDGVRWLPAELDVGSAMLGTIRLRFDESRRWGDTEQAMKLQKWVRSSLFSQRIIGALKVASYEMAGPSITYFDSNPFLLGCENGVIDLKTGEFRQGNQDDLLTKATNVRYDPDAQCPRWTQFLDEIFGGDKEIIDFIQKGVGYTLTGSNREQIFFILYGVGANGKSVFLTVIQEALGDHAQTWRASTLTTKANTSEQLHEMARARGVRFIKAIEYGQQCKLDEEAIKVLTGQDSIVGRHLYHNAFEYVPQFKVWMATNYKPVIQGMDYGIWRRIRFIPFNMIFEEDDPKTDKDLLEKLRAEYPGILNWMIQGCLKWQKDGLKMPATIREATLEYKKEMDTLGDFLGDRCDLNPKGKITSKELYQAYKEWTEENGEEILSPRMFGLLLNKRGFNQALLKVNSKRVRGWKGVSLKETSFNFMDDSNAQE